MSSTKRKPSFIFSVSWEVCNKIGGIYTVLSTQAKTLKEESGATLIYVGPDLWEGKNNPLFIEDKSLYSLWKDYARDTDGIPVRVGYWNIPGRPVVILVDFMSNYSLKNQIYGRAWELFGVDSMHAYGDYDEASMFSYTAAMAVKSFYNFNIGPNDTVVYHAHEWMTGLGAMFLKYYIPQISTVFTTHATSIGRSICGNGKALYEFFDGYNGDQMARELNMEAKHSVEKQTANRVDCFTTVSDITARECTQLLERTPDVVTVNGFEDGFLPAPGKFEAARAQARGCILSVANKLFGTNWSTETPTQTNAGTYTVHYKVVPDDGYTGGVESTSLGSATMAKANGWVTLSPSSSSGWRSGETRTNASSTISSHGGSLSATTSGSPYVSLLTVRFNGNTMNLSRNNSTQPLGGITVTVTSAATTNYNAASATYYTYK